MKLVIAHYHLRPGGVRRIIELATPHLLRGYGGAIKEVVLACGEAPDRKWLLGFQQQLPQTPVRLCVEPVFNYLSEQRLSAPAIKTRIQKAVARLLEMGADDCLVWVHNPSLGRNLLLSRELVRATASRKMPLLFHHHDWWFDNRWPRWAEMRRFGFRSLRSVLEAIFPSASNVSHLTINQADCSALEKWFPGRTHWLPNLSQPPHPVAVNLTRTRRWVRGKCEVGGAPIWLLPCRLLRRKNVAEALLLTRWLRPEAWLLVTGGASSADEQEYGNALARAAQLHHWPLRLGVLQGNHRSDPTVAELLAGSEAVLLTSIVEGFGLPYLEAAAAGRPLIARNLANVAPDLARFGFRFPQAYNDILIDPVLFDWGAEVKRQRQLFLKWRRNLPRAFQAMVEDPVLLARAKPGPVPFSRLTLTAQLEVLAQPVERSWTQCAPLNPFLEGWSKRAAARELRPTAWPRTAAQWLSGGVYARRFAQSVPDKLSMLRTVRLNVAAQNEFVRSRLDRSHLFPLLWSSQT